MVASSCPLDPHDSTGYKVWIGDEEGQYRYVNTNLILKVLIDFDAEESTPKKKIEVIKKKKIDTPQSKQEQKGKGISVISIPNNINLQNNNNSSSSNSHLKNLICNKQLIVIDAPNVAKNHGKNKTFSTLGLQKAIQYYEERDYQVLAILPEHYLEDNVIFFLFS